MISNLLFETPWWFPTAGIALGLYVLFTGNRRQERGVMSAGGAIVILSLAIAMTSYFVETDRERAIRRTHELVQAVSQHDWDKFKSLLDRQTSVLSLRGPDKVTESIKSLADAYNVTDCHITGTDVEQTDTVITVTIRVLSQQSGQSGASDWQLQYQNLGQGWVLFSVQPVGQTADLAKVDRYLNLPQ